MAKEGYGAYLSLLHPLQTIYLAGGCFWGTEHFFKQVHGVKATQVGYANGHTPHPSYHEVCTDTTGFAETVKVEYDPSEVSLAFLLDLYFRAIRPHFSQSAGQRPRNAIPNRHILHRQS